KLKIMLKSVTTAIDSGTDFSELADVPFREDIFDNLQRYPEINRSRCLTLLSQDTHQLMQMADPRAFSVYSDVYSVVADRKAAAFSSWYEMFPRSKSGDVQRHGTFHDVIRRLPAIAAMGFDTLYFPPIHPIGKKNRKGRNNSLTAAPDDPGSPYAIGSDEGGHDAIHP